MYIIYVTVLWVLGLKSSVRAICVLMVSVPIMPKTGQNVEKKSKKADPALQNGSN